jgi:N-acetyl-anhydromuramyl-L-alanine amidase AmpD
MFTNKRHGLLKSRPRLVRAHTVILHHTAGGTLGGAESTLEARGLAYHYMIDKAGGIYEYVPPNRRAAHAYKRNTGTIGIAYIGGGRYGPINPAQLSALEQLLTHLNDTIPTLEYLTGHKHADPRGWKIDPRFPGEPENGVDYKIDRKYMYALAKVSGLEFKK